MQEFNGSPEPDYKKYLRGMVQQRVGELAIKVGKVFLVLGGTLAAGAAVISIAETEFGNSHTASVALSTELEEGAVALGGGIVMLGGRRLTLYGEQTVANSGVSLDIED